MFCVYCPAPATEVVVWHFLTEPGSARDATCDAHTADRVADVRANRALVLDGVADAA